MMEQRSVEDQRAIEHVQRFTTAWMCVEVVVALLTGIRSRSVALAAFGADSAIELISALIVLWRFRTSTRHAEDLATKLTAWLLVALGVYIVTDSVYVLAISHQKPETSYLGVGLLIAAGIVMPWLGRRKRQLAARTNSSALRADAAQSSACAYLAWIALAGVLLNALAGLWWTDPAAALCLVPFVIKEAREAFEGRPCECG